MNPKDFFDISHYKLKRVPLTPPFSDNPIQFNKQIYTIQSAMNSKPHPISKPIQDKLYYINDGIQYEIGKKEIQQGISYVGYSVEYLTYVKYKGVYDIDNLTIETNLESLKRNKVYRVLSQNSFDNVKDGTELLIFNECKLEEQDEYSLSYILVYRVQNSGQQIQEQFKLEKKQQYTFKAFQPFESHYSMVTDNFPVIFLEYQCLNISQMLLDFKSIEFKVDKSMDIRQLFPIQFPLMLQPEECYKIIYQINLKTNDKRQLGTVLYQKKDSTEYDLKLGSIQLQWGFCGQYSGSQKTCLVRLYQVNLKIPKQIEIPRETIISIEIEIELGILSNLTDIALKLDEMEMKAIKIVGLSQMRIQFSEEIKTQKITLDIMAFVGGMHQIRGIKIQDSRQQKQISYKNGMQVCVISKSQEQEQQQQSQQSQQQQQQQQSYDQYAEYQVYQQQDVHQNQESVDLLDMDISPDFKQYSKEVVDLI